MTIPEEQQEEVLTESAPPSREDLFRALYEAAFPDVAAFVSKHGGTIDDARDIFHDALIAYYEKYARGTLALRADARWYVLGIARNTWYRRFAASPGEGTLDERWAANIPTAPSHQQEADENRLRAVLQRAGTKCLELLELFYYRGMGARQVADARGYASDQVASVQKYKCLQKVRDYVKQKAMRYDDFFS